MRRANHTVLDMLDSEAFRSFENHVPCFHTTDAPWVDWVVDVTSSDVSIFEVGMSPPIAFPALPVMADFDEVTLVWELYLTEDF